MQPIWIAFLLGIVAGMPIGMLSIWLYISDRKSDNQAKLHRSIAGEIRRKNCSINP